MVKANYWDVSDEQIIEKTGKSLSHWKEVLERFGASEKKSNDVVSYLQNEHGVPRYWARTLVTWYAKR